MYSHGSRTLIGFYGQDNANLKVINHEFERISTLDDLFRALLKCWSRDTAYPICQQDYCYEEDPTYGQCAITSMIVNDLFGGTIHKININGGGTHYFNKINNHYIDLTSDQFDLYNIPINYEPNQIIDRNYCGRNKNTLERYLLLKRKLKNNEFNL